MKKSLLFLVPVLLLAGFIGLSIEKLQKGEAPRTSRAVGRTVPALSLPGLDDEKKLTLEDLRGQVFLVNFFASWCVPCVAEHPFLKTMDARGVPVVGVAYKDKVVAARAFLEKHGNPYRRTGLDQNGEGAIEWGLTGVPETFLVDARGQIAAHVAGPLNEETWARGIQPALEEATRNTADTKP